MSRNYLTNRLYLQRVNLKRPLSRGSHFKIYFRLENRRNRGLRQNFHGISFSKDRVLIISGRYVTHKFITITYLSKIMKFNLSMDVKRKREYQLIRTKVQYETMVYTCSDFLFLLFSVDFINKIS